MAGRSRYVHRTALLIFAGDLLLVLSLFIAPATLEPGTVINLEGRANAMDYQDIWNDLDPFHYLVYTFGDFNCHQIEQRSIIINGNQMPVCARDTGIFMGILFGSIILARAIADDSPATTMLSVFPKRFRENKFVGRRRGIVSAVILVLLILPTGLDGGIQMLSTIGILPFGLTYESTNPTRLLTGFSTGVAWGLLMTMLIMTLVSRRENGEPPLLPILKSR
ncbi:MAG: DUF2085 domain-containing protein [Candidatus Thermoplasmatota archaeon]|nr:DUF2085 domain-containing protein [Candidatus Thermoplasmatota archaeon]